MKSKKVVVSGTGIICSLGNNINEILTAIKNDKQGLQKIKSFNLEKISSQIGGEVIIPEIQFPEEIKDKCSQLAYIAMKQAIEDAKLNFSKIDPYRCGLSYGTCNGNVISLENYYENLNQSSDEATKIFQNHYNAIDSLNRFFNIKGPKIIFVTACAASNNAIGYAYDLISSNQADIVIVGGADSFGKSTFAGFHSLQSLNPEGSSPFSNRIGISLGEGAGFLIIESEASAQKRNAPIYAEICGYGFGGDAYHATTPDVTGEGARWTMEQAINESKIDKKDIKVVCAHGTGTEANDKAETLAIRNCFGQYADEMVVTSTKSLYGHTLGAAGITQGIIMIHSMLEGFIPPIIHFETEREGCDLHYAKNKPVKLDYNYFLSNSFAFGGNNVSVLFGKYKPEEQKTTISIKNISLPKIVITGWNSFTPTAQNTSNMLSLFQNNNFLKQQNKLIKFEKFILNNPKFRKFGKAPIVSKLAIQSVEQLLSDSNYVINNANNIGLIWGVCKGTLRVFEQFFDGIKTQGIQFGSALDFPHIVLNSIAGQISIAFGIKGCNTTIAGQFSPFMGIKYASEIIQKKLQESMVVGGSDKLSSLDELLFGKFEYILTEGVGSLLLEDKDCALKRKANIYAEIDGFASTSFGDNINLSDSYITCINNTLSKTNLTFTDIDLYIPSVLGLPLPTINLPLTYSSQLIGTGESASALFNIGLALNALKTNSAPHPTKENEFIKDDFKTILLTAVSQNGNCYSFILKK